MWSRWPAYLCADLGKDLNGIDTMGERTNPGRAITQDTMYFRCMPYLRTGWRQCDCYPPTACQTHACPSLPFHTTLPTCVRHSLPSTVPHVPYSGALQPLMLLHVTGGWESAATARACLPYWLETAGWLAALLADATAAAVGRLPALKPFQSQGYDASSLVSIRHSN